MATDQAYINETIAQIAAVAAKVVVQAILAERGDGDEFTRHRSEDTGMRPKLGGPTPTFNFTNEVKNSCQIHNIDKAENIHVLKICYANKLSYRQNRKNVVKQSNPSNFVN